MARKVKRRRKRNAIPSQLGKLVPPYKDRDAADTQRHRLLRTSNRSTRLRSQTQGNKTILERAFGSWIVSTPSTRPGNTPSQRRSQRIFLCVGIVVHGQKADGVAFSERTKTEVVSAHGALILLREPVSVGQNLTLRNILTSEEVRLHGGRKQPGTSGVAEVGVQLFTQAQDSGASRFHHPMGVRVVRKPKDSIPKNANPPQTSK